MIEIEIVAVKRLIIYVPILLLRVHRDLTLIGY